MDDLESPSPSPTPYSRSPTPSTFERGRTSRRTSSGCPSSPDPPPGSPLRIPRRTSSQSQTFTISGSSQRKPLFLPAGAGNTVHRDASTPPPPPLPPGFVPGLDNNDSFSTPMSTPARDLPLRRSFSGSSSMSSKVAKKRSSGFSLKKAWQMAGDEDNAANQLVADAASPSPVPRPSTGLSHSRRENDWKSAAATSLGSSKSSFDSDDFRSLGGSATTAASSFMKGSHHLDDKENNNNTLSGIPLPSKRSSIFGSVMNRPKTSDANMELNAGGLGASYHSAASQQQSTAGGPSAPHAAHATNNSASSISSSNAGDQVSTPSPKLNNGSSPKDRIKDWGKSTVHRIPILRRFRSTTEEPDKERMSRRKSMGFFGAAYDKDVPLPSIEDGADARLGASPLSRPASIAEESPNKTYSWQVEDDFTGNDLQVSDSPMLKYKQAADKYSEPDFAGAGEDGGSPNSTRRFPLLGRNTKLDEIRKRELDADQAIPQVDTAAPRPKNTKLDEIRLREVEGLPARTVAGLKLEEFREINSRARSPSPESRRSVRDSTPAASLHQQQTPPSSTQSTPEKKHAEREAEEGMTPAATIEPEPQPPLPSMDPIAELRSRSDPGPFATSSQAPRPAPALLSRVSSRDKATTDKMRESTILEEEGEQIPNTPVTAHQRHGMPTANPPGEAGHNINDDVNMDNGRHRQQDLLRRLARAASPASTSPADQKPIAPASGSSGGHDAAPATTSATTNQGRHEPLINDPPPSPSKSKLPTSTSRLYSSLTNAKHASAYSTTQPNIPEKATIRRTVSSPADRTKRLSLPLPPETTITTIGAVANSGTSSRPSSIAFETASLRRVKSVETARLRGKGKKMDDATDRIAAEMSLFAPGNDGSERGSIRAPSPVPSDWDEVDDDDLGAVNDNDATPKAKRTADPLSMPTPQVPGAFAQTPATTNPESTGLDPLDDGDANSDFRPRKLDFRPSPSPLRHERKTSAGSGLGAVGTTATAAAAAAATTAVTAATAAAAGFGIGAALGSSIVAASSAANTAAKAASSSTFGLSTVIGSRRRVSAENSSGVDSDPEDTTSVRQSRGTRDTKTRRARSLSRRRKPTAAKVPSAKDDLAELRRLHHIDSDVDKTLDDFENMMGASLSFSSDGSSPAFDRSYDAAGGRSRESEAVAEAKEQAQSEDDEDDEDDTEAKEEKLANFVRRLSTSTLASIRDASKGIARLEDQVSHAEGRAREDPGRRELEIAEQPDPTPEAKPLSQLMAGQDLRPEIKAEPADIKIEEIPSIKLEDIPVVKRGPTPEPLPVPTTKASSGVPVTIPPLYTRKPSFRLTLLGLAALVFAMWYTAETAVCNDYCRPATCDPSKPCVWNPSDPTWGTALPTKLDEWVADGAGANMLEQATDVVSDVWTDIFGSGDYDVVGRGFAQRRRMARRLKRRVNATRGGSAGASGELGGLGIAVTQEQRAKWDAWHRARMEREQRDRDEVKVAEMREMGYAAELEEDGFGVDERVF